MVVKRRALTAASALAVATVVLTGCSSGGGDDGSGPVEIEYLGWVAGLQDSVDIWNEENPDIQVTLNETTGSDVANPLIRAGVEAGNAPCLTQMAYASITNFVADDLLLPVTDEAAEFEDDFLGWTWSQVSPGGETYGIPQDIGPMVLFYNQAKFDEFGIEVPTTWDEYAAASAAVKAKDPTVSLGFHGVDDVGNYAGLVSQNGGNWTAIDGDEWKVAIDDQPALEVADYWQGLVDRQETLLTPRFDAGIYPLFADGKILSMIGASWNFSSLPANVPEQSGQWRVAQLPNWGTPASGNSGGSASVVLKGCENPAEAVEFAAWLNSSEASLDTLASPDAGGLYPAAVEALAYDVVNQPVEYYGGQNVFEEFAASAEVVDTSWQFGPTADGTDTAYADGFAGIATGEKTFPEVASEVQEITLAEMNDRGIAASAR